MSSLVSNGASQLGYSLNVPTRTIGSPNGACSLKPQTEHAVNEAYPSISHSAPSSQSTEISSHSLEWFTQEHPSNYFVPPNPSGHHMHDCSQMSYGLGPEVQTGPAVHANSKQGSNSTWNLSNDEVTVTTMYQAGTSSEYRHLALVGPSPIQTFEDLPVFFGTQGLTLEIGEVNQLMKQALQHEFGSASH